AGDDAGVRKRAGCGGPGPARAGLGARAAHRPGEHGAAAAAGACARSASVGRRVSVGGGGGTGGRRMTQVTFQATPGTVETRWYLVVARGLTLGRLALTVAWFLAGQQRPPFEYQVIR